MDRTSIYGKFKVKMLEEKEEGEFTVRKFEMGEDSPYMAPVSPILFTLLGAHRK